MALPVNYTSQLQIITSIRSLPYSNTFNFGGYDAETITSVQNALYPDTPLDVSTVQALLVSGSALGIYLTNWLFDVSVARGCTNASPDTQPFSSQLYIVNGAMVAANPRNAVYAAPAPFVCEDICNMLGGSARNNLQGRATQSYSGTLGAQGLLGGGYSPISGNGLPCGSCPL